MRCAWRVRPLTCRYTPISGQDPSGPIPYDPHAPIAEQIHQSFANSLRSLHPDTAVPDVRAVLEDAAGKQKQRDEQLILRPLQPVYIDSYLMHSPLTTLEGTVEAWRAMESLVAAGLVRRIGFSNVYDPTIFGTLFQLARIKPSILQNRWHHSTGHDVSLLSMLSPVLSPNTFPTPPDGVSPIGVTYQPFWTLTGNTRLRQSAVVAEIASKYALTPEQVVYAFVHQGMGIPGLTACVLSGTTNEDHMREAIAATELEPWPEADIVALRREVYGE